MANNRTLTITVAGDDRSWLRTVKSVDEGAKKIRGSIGETDKSTAALAGTMKSLYSTAAKVGSLGLAAQGISALGAGAVAATSSLAPLAGALGAIPALASAAGQGMGVFKLATSNILDAVGGLNESLVTTSKAFKELDPQAKKIALRLEELKKPIRELSAVAQKGMFPGFEKAIIDISKNLPVLERGVGRTAKVLGDLAAETGKALGSAGFGRDLETQMKRNDVTIRRFGEGALNLFEAIRHVTIAAGPMVDFFTDAGVGLTELIEKQAKAGRESGALARFFKETEIVGSRVGRIISDLGKALVNIGTIAYNTLGKRLLGDLTKATDQFRVWTDSAKGQNAIKKFFQDAEPAIRELARLMKDVTVAFFELGRGDQVAPLLKTVRTELLPAIKAMVAGTTKEFMPAFLAFATESIKLFTHLGGSSGPLVQFTVLLGRIVGGVNKLLDKFPLLNDAVVGLVVAGGISKALRIGAAITGMTKLIGMLKTAAGIGAAGGAAKGAGGIGGKIKDVVTGAGKVRGATPANPLFVAVVAGGGGGVASKTPDIVGKLAKGGAIRVALATVGAPAAGILGAAFAAHFLAKWTARNDFKTRGQEPADRAQAGKAPRDNRGAFDRVLKDAKPLQNVPALNKLADALDRVGGAGKGGRAPQVKVLADRMREALRQGDRRKIGQVADQLEKLAGQGSGKSSRMLRDLAAEAKHLASRGGDDLKQTRRELGLTRNEFARMSADGSVSMREIRQTVARNTKRIKDHLGDDSAAGKKALAQNFREARKAVRETMRDGVVSTRTGLKQIKDLMARELSATYGITLAQAKAYGKSSSGDYRGSENPNPAGGHQRGGRVKLAGGGWIGARGMVSDDVVPVGPGALAAYGEYFATGAGGRGAVINRHQAPTVEAHLALGGYPGLDQGADLGTIERAMGGAGGLSSLFASVKRPHMLAKGGIVPVPGFPGESANASVVGKIVAIAKRFGLTLTDAYGQGHDSPGHTKTGTAADFSGPDKSMDAAVKMLVQQGYLVGYDGRFGSQNWPDHGPSTKTSNFHLHVELGGKGGKITGGTGASHRKIAVPQVRGGGAMGVLAQRGLKMATAAANRMMTAAGESAAATPVSGGGGGAAAPPGRVRSWLAAGLRLAGQAPSARNINTLYGRVMQESGGNPRAQNNWDSNAKAGTPSKGLLQTIDPTFQAYKVKGHGDIWNPVHNVAAAVRYMLAEYGRLVAASGSGYQKGGYTYPLSKRGKIIGTPHGGTHTLGNWQSDNAVDIAAPTGTGVIAMLDGRIAKVSGSYQGGASRFDGFQVTMQTDRGQLFYTHLSKAGVKAGQDVKAGQRIGSSGAANNVPHLHLGFQKGNPLKRVGRAKVGAAGGGGGGGGGGGKDDFYSGFSQAQQQSQAIKRGEVNVKGQALSGGGAAGGMALGVARAQRSQAGARAKDNLASLIKALVAEVRLKRKRLKRIRKVLKGRITKARRQRLVEEEGQLIGEVADLAAAIKEYRADAAGGATTVSGAEELDAGVDTEAVAAAAAAEEERIANLPTAADYIQAKIDEASLTADTADDKAALQELVALRSTELTAARATGDPRKISDAIQAYKSATEALNGLDDSVGRLAETMKSLQEEMKRQNDIYASVVGVSSREAVKAMADMISGQIVGVGLQGRRQTAGTGATVLIP